MIRQAKILRDKKLARMAKVARQIRPRVNNGIVQYDSPTLDQPKDVKKFSAPPAATTARKVIPSSQTIPQQEQAKQSANPKKLVRKQQGCSGCKRRIGG